MKRNSLTTAVVAGIAGTVGIANLATATTLNPDGLGQVLIYPYYTVNKPNNGTSAADLFTLFSVVNTTNEGKAVKVRFLEGRNSREVRDFNLYLSPYDVWTATVFRAPGEEEASLVTSDTSCTAPAIRTASSGIGPSPSTYGQLPDGRKFLRFTNLLFRDDANYGAGGSVGRSLANTREGHLEIIEMGVVGNNPGQDGGAAQNSIAAITHVAGVPANCNKILGAWSAAPTPGYWIEDESVDLSRATGGLFGSAAIVDVDNGTMLSYSPEAVDGFYSPSDDGYLHSEPKDTRPSLNDAGWPDATATALVFRNGQIVQATYGAPWVNAVSAVFAHDAIFNEYVLGGAAAASTDWVITFPTKGFYVDRPYRVPAGGTVRPPFEELFNQGSDVTVGVTPFDREEAGLGECTGSDADNPACYICPSPCDPGDDIIPVLPWETQIISFQTSAAFVANRTSPVLGSALAMNFDLRADDLRSGWVRFGFDTSNMAHAMVPSAEGVVFRGLPVTGFAATNYINANVAGKLANYGGLWRHKGSRSCTGGTACS